MPRWFHRIARNSRAGPLIAGLTAIVALGSCGGAMLANFTVAGMDRSYHGSTEPAFAAIPPAEAGWADRAADNLMDEGRIAATRAGYAAEEPVATEYAIGE
ncbi:hypothetical protein P1X14_00970 [Sphingomonas sp. AOB5]|uniref:hypothetical protein n=1 Tax=Sphingomonas sp. AOB5 TaxID=3034017 RepID=UPI0023F7535E|nr:hypothetical protein [Sphingomonas sp. AOB5]MDF7773804.1 hypothetical protein [Sphingomonas sp. AOB5]